MVHHGQRLPLGLEAGHNLPCVHSQLDDLQRHAAPDRLLLLGHIDNPAAAFADLLQEPVAADPIPHCGTSGKNGVCVLRVLGKEAEFGFVGMEQLLHAGTQVSILPAGVLDEGEPSLARLNVQRLLEDRLLQVIGNIHKPGLSLCQCDSGQIVGPILLERSPKFFVQPGTGIGPSARRRAFWNAKQTSSFLAREPGKEPHFHQFRPHRIDRRKFL